MTTSLEIRLLGPFEALVGGRRAEVTGPKRPALLALLALRCGRVVPVEVLVDALWGAEVPAAPRNAVQHHVSRLRAALGADSIAAAPDGYALASATVDALQFEELLAKARSAQRAGDAGQAAELVGRGAGDCGVGVRCRACRTARGSVRRPPAWRRCGSTPWRSSSRRHWRWGSTPRWSAGSAGCWRNIRSGSGCGAS